MTCSYPRRSTRQLLWLSALLFVAAGCSFEEPDRSIMNQCTTDADCAGTATCDLTREMCVSRPETPLRVALEVTSAGGPSDRFASWTFPAQDVAGPTTRDLSMPSTVTLVGNVRFGDQRVPATISLVPSADQNRVTASTFPESVEVPDGAPADFAVQIVAGQSYDLIVEPKGERVPGTEIPWLRQLPPLRFPGIETPDSMSEAEVFIRVDVGYPEDILTPCDGERVSACRFTGMLVSEDAEDRITLEEGQRVRAIDPETGEVVSSTAATSEGLFSLTIAPNVERYVLRITGGADRPLFPTVTADPAFFYPGENPPRVLVPQLTSVTYSGSVETEDDTPARVATLSFVSQDVFDDELQVSGSFQTTAMTDESGRFSVELLRGTYEVVVSSGAIEGVSITREPAVFADSVSISPPPEQSEVMGQVFRLPERAHFGGRVVTTDLEPMRETVVEGLARNVPGMADVSYAARFNRSSTALTDETGQFDLRLDVGSYDVLIKPATESGYAWVVVPNVVIGSVGSDAPSISNSYEFSAPVPLQGTLLGPAGKPLAEAELRAYVELDETGRRVQLARTITDENGHYEVLLPSRVLSAP